MRNAFRLAVVIWGSLLLLTLWLVFCSGSAGVKYSVAVVLVVVIVITLFRWRSTPASADENLNLPEETWQQPVVLVAGDGAEHLFPERSLRQVSAGLYVHVADQTQISRWVDRLLSQRPGWARQIYVAQIVLPELHKDEAVLKQQLRGSARTLNEIRRRTGASLPLLLWSYLPNVEEQKSPSWFIRSGNQVQVVEGLESRTPVSYQRLSLALSAENRMAWLNQHVLPELKTTPPQAVGIGFAISIPAVEGNQWQAWMTARTSLTPDVLAPAKPEGWTFPDAILPLLPRESGFTSAKRAWGVWLLMTTAAAIAALCFSAMANRTLLRQVADDIQKYQAIPMAEFDAKARQLAVLKADAEKLDTWYREGEPLRLGFGLYPGERIRQPVLRIIRDYRRPEPKGDLAPSGLVQTVRLDSMALFDVGQARLKRGSTNVLVDALVNIRAKPGWLILVAGHTDATGDEKSNQQLSLRRAEAVRDWMLHTSDIPATCFAVQGQGESQPAATNDTPEGRAMNRRVEISLVPRTDACQDVEPQMPPDAAVSQRNQQGE